MSDIHKSRAGKHETVLVMQGGGSLGAYECGVCKTLAKHNIKLDILAGTSIGAINATIIAAGYTKEDGINKSVKRLEDFWMELADNISLPAFLPYKERSEMAAAYSLFYGNQKAFTPLWVMPGGLPYYYFFNSPYLYNIGKLKRTISKHVDFTKLSSRKNKFTDQQRGRDNTVQDQNTNSNNSNKITAHNSSDDNDNDIPRLILTATNVRTGEPVIFDSNNTDITVDHVTASAGYAVYGLPWTRINDNYYWDGALVHNTPLKAVINTDYEKIVYVSDVFPRKQEKLPTNMPETYHRIRDLLFTDRSIQEVKKTSDITKKYHSLIEQMHDVISSSALHLKHDSKLKLKLDKIESEYKNLVSNRGSIMDRIVHIQRKERKGRHYIFEDADFSVDTIRELIKQGEEDAEEAMPWE